jgi:hypothetical protein
MSYISVLIRWNILTQYHRAILVLSFAILLPILGTQNLHAQCEPALTTAPEPLMSVDTSNLTMMGKLPGDWSLQDEIVGGLNPERYLRALSLDLRGTLPTLEEYDDLLENNHINASVIGEWLQSDRFAQQLTRLHHGWLWNNVENLNLYNNRANLRTSQGRYWRTVPAQTYRGDRVACLDEPARFGDQGEILTTEVEGNQLEGWVWVQPYWSNEPVRVCAFDAQDALYADNGTFCGSNAGFGQVSCGCGPQMQWCVTGAVRNEINRALAESLDRLMAEVFASGESYLSLFQSSYLPLNGVLVHFLRHHQQISRYSLNPSPVPSAFLPSMNYQEQDRWVSIVMPSYYSGILTHPAFLLRFQTNRARANRFFDAFLCSPFQPPEGGLPVADEESARDPDLQNRAGCKYCHALLEPAAAYWGRWTEQGIAYLSAERFPAEREDCLNCALTGQGCNNECRSHYLTNSLSDREIPYLGKLKAYTFRKSEHAVNVEQGPRLLAFTEVADQRLPQCVAQRTAEWLLGRSMDPKRDIAWIEALGIRFARQGFDYQQLIFDIVSDERYRRVK